MPQVSTCHLGVLVLVTAWFLLGPLVLALTWIGSLAVVPFILLKDGSMYITSARLWHGQRQSLATSSARETCTAFISSVMDHFPHHLNGQGHFTPSLFFSSVKFDKIGHILLEISFYLNFWDLDKTMQLGCWRKEREFFLLLVGRSLILKFLLWAQDLQRV